MTERVVKQLESVTIRFAGDSGDGMQLTGSRFTDTAAVIGNDVATFPDFPAEIRAPAGSLPGVSGFQVQFSSRDIHTPGDRPDVLVAMNPAALKVNLKELPRNGTLLVNEDAFTAANLKLAKYTENPLEDSTLEGYRVFKIPMSSMTVAAVAEVGLGRKAAERCKNFFALGLLYFLYQRQLDETSDWIKDKFAKAPDLAQANILAMKAGHNFADTLEAFQEVYQIDKAPLTPGTYRSVNGNLATAYGLVVAAHKTGQQLFYGSYPITPASDILHELSRLRAYNVKTFQAEDEIAAMGSTVGAAYAGAIAVTGTSGPGVALKTEAIGLAVITELPMVIVNVQRGGPSTGLPTKTEQADLFQAIMGRNGECPLPVLAARSPADCFEVAIEAVRIAVRYMTPVMVLTDGFVANGAEPWRIPDIESIDPIEVKFTQPEDVGEEGFLPYERDPETLGRHWAIPGTPELMHRIGGLEKDHLTGEVNYVPENHFEMIKTRAEKVDRVAQDYPALKVDGPEEGPLLILGWGSTHGSIVSACERLRTDGHPVANLNLRHLNPLPRDLGDVLARYEKVLIPELNLGQLAFILRSHYLRDFHSLPKVMGQPFKLDEIMARAEELLGAVKTA
ncbi:2-oxoglutarate ferredoxin oxidoreductase subunit alpha [bacterium]|nr:MAG: 2-oxoglutarate ferredoxin oxidoreductase subunit alpha [bacterium]RKZ17836.1 MAG: 2-oxoglutarate ferredoxin oxidoreductase subunit alpha [bacterium]